MSDIVEAWNNRDDDSDMRDLCSLGDAMADEIERLRDLLLGCVEHMEHSTPQGKAAWDAANEEMRLEG